MWAGWLFYSPCSDGVLFQASHIFIMRDISIELGDGLESEMDVDFS
jgi:hypothetical protein